jgi:hypothetical protein
MLSTLLSWNHESYAQSRGNILKSKSFVKRIKKEKKKRKKKAVTRAQGSIP